MACPDTNTVQALLDGTLAEEEREALLGHTADCAECRAVMGALMTDSVDTLVDRSATTERELARGTLLGRFSIEERLGRGAMGVVYAAHDPELDRRVAIKLVRADPLDHDSSGERRARMQREAQALARVSHANVITVFDVGAYQGQVFIAMELVNGWTMRGWLAAEPRGWREVLARYLAAGHGLAAAHAVGVVHRDFKPDNVLVGRDGRVRVTDFGLARRSGGAVREEPSGAPSSRDSTLTETGTIMGTPAYMAPEQLAGQPADEAWDQFSFCVSLYEGLHGERPFSGRNFDELHDSVRTGKVRAAPAGVRVPTALRRLLVRGLARHPRARHPSLARLIELLEAMVAPRRRLWLAAPAGLAVLATAVLLAGRGRPVVTEQSSGPRPGIAVLPLRNASAGAGADWIASSLADMLATELAAGEKLRTVPTDTIRRIRGRPGAELDSPAALSEKLDARFLVTGSYAQAAGGIRVNLRLEEPGGAGVLSSYAETVAEAGLVNVATHAAARFRARLRVPDLSAEETARARTSLPHNPEAARLYTEALERMRAGDQPGAMPLLEQSVARDPRFAQAQAELAGLLWGLGYGERARLAADAARALAPELTREEQLAVEGRAAAGVGDTDKAIENFKLLYGFFPDRHDYGMELLETYGSAHMNDEALALLRKLRAVGPPISDDPELDRVEMFVVADIGEIDKTIELATRVAERGRLEKTPYLVGDALFNLGHATWAAGRLEEAEKAFADLFAVQLPIDDPNGLAVSLRALGLIRKDEGRLAEARVNLLEGLTVEKRAGSGRSPYAPAPIAEIALMQGDLAGAEAVLSATTLEESRHAPIWSLLALQRAKLDVALQRADEYVDQTKVAPFFHCRALLVRGRVRLARGDPAGARADFEGVRDLAQKKHYELARGRAELALAELALDEGGPVDEHLRAARPALRFTPDVAWATALAARAARSASAAAEARGLAAKMEDVTARELVLLAAAEVERDGAAAEAVRRRATARGLMLIAMEARLVAARLGREPLAAVARDARALGLGRIARLASRR